MNRHPTIEVSDWQETAVTVPAHRRLISPASIGVLGTILIHAVILPSTYLGTRGEKGHRPEIQETHDTAPSGKAASYENLVVLTMPTPSHVHVDARLMAPPPTLMKFVFDAKSIPDPPQLPDLESLAPDDDHPSPSAGAGGPAEQARLSGIYAGQVLARINRVWRRPRTPVTESTPSSAFDATFQCEAQIVQDFHGNVQGILLPRCNGSAAWQRSLLRAIQEASPLPAPPSPSVFSRSVTLSFTGIPYFAGANEGEYEINPPQMAQSGAIAQHGSGY